MEAESAGSTTWLIDHLLDYTRRWHRRRGWPLRRLHQEIVTCSTCPTSRGINFGKNKFSTWKLFCFFLRFHFFTSPSRFATSSCFDHESQAGPLNVRRRMRLGHHCRAPPLAVQPSPAPTIRHGVEARRVGAGARRWADLQVPVTSTGAVCGQANPGGRGEIVVGATQSADRSFFDEPTRSVW